MKPAVNIVRRARNLRRKARGIAASVIALLMVAGLAALLIPDPEAARTNPNQDELTPTLTAEQQRALADQSVVGQASRPVSADDATEVAIDLVAMTAMQEIISERAGADWDEDDFMEAILYPAENARLCAANTMMEHTLMDDLAGKIIECINDELDRRNEAERWPDYGPLMKEAEARKSLWNLWDNVNPATRFRAMVIIANRADPVTDPAFREFTQELAQEGCNQRVGAFAKELAGIKEDAQPPQEVWQAAIQSATQCVREAALRNLPEADEEDPEGAMIEGP